MKYNKEDGQRLIWNSMFYTLMDEHSIGCNSLHRKENELKIDEYNSERE